MLVRVPNPNENLLPVNASKTAPSGVDRREFIKTSSLAAGALAFGVPALVRGQHLNSKLNIACIGIGGLSVSRPSFMNTTRYSVTWHSEQINVLVLDNTDSAGAFWRNRQLSP